MLYSYRATVFIITFFTTHHAIMVASDSDSVSPINTSKTRPAHHLALPQYKNYAAQRLSRKKDLLYTFSKEEIEASWHRTMICLADMRKTYGSNEEYLTRINQEQSKYIAAYHEVARYRTFSPTRLTRIEDSVDHFSMYFNKCPVVPLYWHTKPQAIDSRHETDTSRFSAYFDPRPLERILKKNNTCGSDETESSDIFSALTSTLPIEQNA